jgi:4-amino-4-deoxy-L-arabinose transferase-like glycosyltransferase
MLAATPQRAPLTGPSTRITLVTTLLLALLVTAPALFWHRIPARDSANYALLTEEFAHGNFPRAFHPALPPLLTTLGGTLAQLVPDPFLANQIASILLFLLGLPGTYLLTRELRGERMARIAAVLYAVCPYTVDLAASGGVDAGKLGLLPWLTWAVLRWNRSGRPAWGLAVGGLGALLALARGEGVFFAIAAVLWHVADGFWNRRHGPASLAKRLSGVVGATVSLVLFMTPWLLYEHRQTGLWITHPTQFSIYARFGISDRWPRETIIDDNAMEAVTPATAAPAITTASGATEALHAEDVDLRDLRKGVRWLKNLEKVAKGAYIPYLILALAGALKRRRDEPAPPINDHFPLIFVGLNLAIFVPTNILAPRYISATIPLFLHFTALGVIAVEQHLSRLRWFSCGRLQTLAAAGLIVLGLLSQKQLDVFMDARKHQQQLELMRVGQWIRQHGQSFPNYGVLPNFSTYHNGRVPILLESDGRLRYYARTDGICLYPFYRFTPEQITTICRQGKVSLIWYDEKMEGLCPGFGQYWPGNPSFTAVDGWQGVPSGQSRDGGRLLAFDPERTAPR